MLVDDAIREGLYEDRPNKEDKKRMNLTPEDVKEIEAKKQAKKKAKQGQ